MSTREHYPAGVPCWVDTNQPDAAAAANFYSGLLGWETEDEMPPESGQNYFMGRLGGRDVGAISRPSDKPPVWTTYISVEYADDAARRVRDAGGQVVTEPFDVLDAGRMAVCADPEGAVFCLWQAGQNRGSAAVNEHGAVNFNSLHTDDLEGAKAFYAAVFGWVTIGVGSPMWTLPGYGDHLEEINPGTRARPQPPIAPAARPARARFEASCPRTRQSTNSLKASASRGRRTRARRGIGRPPLETGTSLLTDEPRNRCPPRCRHGQFGRVDGFRALPLGRNRP